MMLSRYGGCGNTPIVESFNLWVFAGCICYLIGAVTGIYAFSKVSANHVNPSAVLQGVPIYFYSTAFLGGRPVKPALPTNDANVIHPLLPKAFLQDHRDER